MAVTRAQERRLLTGAELEAVQASHHPELAGLGQEEVMALARRLREQRNRLRDQSRAQRRARVGRAEPRSGNGSDEHGLSLRKQVIAGALRRVNGQVERMAGKARAQRNTTRLKEALERRQAAPVHHPSAGRTEGEGMRSNENPKRTIDVEPGLVGSVSQQNRAFQARKDEA